MHRYKAETIPMIPDASGLQPATVSIAAAGTATDGTDFTAKVVSCESMENLGILCDMTGSTSTNFTVTLSVSIDGQVWVDKSLTFGTGTDIQKFDVSYLRMVKVKSIANNDGTNAGQVKLVAYAERNI